MSLAPVNQSGSLLKSSSPLSTIPTLARVVPTGIPKKNRIEFRPHRGQTRAWQSQKRFILILAGSQSGKTSFGPHWLFREIQQKGPGDYLVVTPTFQLLDKKALPEFRRLFEAWLKVGRWISSPSRRFEFSPEGSRRTFGFHDPDQPTTVWFGYAEDPESLESATAKAAWLDEAGQRKFKLGSWEAIQRRLAIHQGRVLLTTTPYDLGWLKQKLWDPWKAAHEAHPEIDVIRFDSTENPIFPQAEWDRAKATMPGWKFSLFYRAIFTRPAGQIYDSFIDELAPRGHKRPRFAIPPEWERSVGLDFGNVNTAACFYAHEQMERKPTGRLILYRTYHTGGRTPEEHVQAILLNEPRTPTVVGGSASEDEWREKFRDAGLPVQKPTVRDVEVGIGSVYGAHREGQILVFDDLDQYLSDKTTYARKLDTNGEPLLEIEDKNCYHLLDAERYIISELRGPERTLTTDDELHDLLMGADR